MLAIGASGFIEKLGGSLVGFQIGFVCECVSARERKPQRRRRAWGEIESIYSRCWDFWPKGLNRAFIKVNCTKQTGAFHSLSTNESTEISMTNTQVYTPHTLTHTQDISMISRITVSPSAPDTELPQTPPSITATLYCRSTWAWMSGDDLQQERRACVAWLQSILGRIHTHTYCIST